jgi:hypothetical protein
MTKNDAETIENWILYHAYHFGFKNLYLLDGSDNQQVLDIYDFYKKHGLNVHHSSTGLNGLADELTSLMRQHEDFDGYLIKMDSDEYLAHTGPPLLARSNAKSINIMLKRLKEKEPDRQNGASGLIRLRRCSGW